MDGTSKKEKIICIGAGASGLFFALNRADDDHEVILLDRNAKVGRKMYISGKGRCNITNDCDVKTFINNIVTNPRFMYSAINSFKPADTIAFFNERDCALKTERGGRVFPVSDKASDIIDTLFFECKRKGVRILFEQKVKEVFKREDRFFVVCEDKTYTCDKLVIATGGMSYASTGSTGDGYRFAESFGHTVVEPKSALCPIKVKEKISHEMLKLTLRNVSLRIRSGKYKKEIFGDLEFLPGRITGPIVLSASSLINRMEDIELSLDLKPALDEETLDRRILREIEEAPNKDVLHLLNVLMPKQFISFFVENTKTDTHVVLNSLSKKARRKLIEDLKHFPLSFDGLDDIDKGIVTSGGVSVKEVDPKSFGSKLCEGLYFIGEVLDVDCLTGGFNMQCALSMGCSCAKNME
ncbi:MAG: NAD(P)/FAD-dependent oxidoreductase [Erysipelotrichaceae bacterium]|nr:NAD(P)/FAD-dependent oxidoreductase [Erysipelotrichaceae bacterium]